MSFNILLKSQLERLMDKLFPQLYSYGICTTERDYVLKNVTLEGFILKRGARITVRFSNTSTTKLSAGTIMLNVNSTGRKYIKLSDTNDYCSYEYENEFCDNKVQQFVYDGTNWVWLRGQTSSSGDEGNTVIQERLIAEFTSSRQTLFTELVSQFYPYLDSLTPAQLHNSYLLRASENTSLSTVAVECFKFCKVETITQDSEDTKIFYFSVIDTNSDKTQYINGKIICISEGEAFMTNAIGERNLREINWYGDLANSTYIGSSETYSLYVLSNTEADAFVTTSEFENIT